MSAVLDLPHATTEHDATTSEATLAPVTPSATPPRKSGSKAKPRKRQTSAEYRESWRQFAPRFSVAIFPLTLELGSGMAQKRFGEWFGRQQMASHLLCNYLPDLIDAKSAQEVLDVLVTQNAAAEEVLKEHRDSLRSLATEAGLRQEREWSRPLKLSVPCTNRYHLDFLNIVRLFDDIIWHLDALSTFGIITNRDRIAQRQKAAKIVASVSVGTSVLWTRAKASALRDIDDANSIQALNDAESESEAHSQKVVDDINAQVVEQGIVSDPSDDTESPSEEP